MPIRLPLSLIILLNVIGWPIVHLVVGWLMTQCPAGWFNPHGWLLRARRWEGNGRFYERCFRVRRWKASLPDGAAWFRGGMPKATLGSSDPDHLNRFLVETARSETAHWLMLASAPLFFLWNPLWADAVMLAYAIAANLPCIVVQRYNRIRLQRVLDERSSAGRAVVAARGDGRDTRVVDASRAPVR